MSKTNPEFERAAKAAKSLPERPDNETMLQLYALFKQGSVGDVEGERPGFFDFVGVAKFEAWGKLKGTAIDEAQARYISLVAKLSDAT